MRTIRRIYFYALAFLSTLVIIWGVIGLLRTIVAVPAVGRNAAQLATALSLTLVGLPIFLLHWLTCQRDARRDPEEAGSWIRAVFLYGILFATLVPILQNTLAVFNRAFLLLFELPSQQAAIGGSQNWADNLIAIGINAAAAAYFYTILRQAWKQDPPEHHLAEVRRLYRYLWMLYGLGLVIFGVQQNLMFLLYIPQGLAGSSGFMLANGLTLLLGGTPLWVSMWNVIQRALAAPAEQQSLLRLVLLYALALIGVGGVLGSAGVVLAILLRLAFGEVRPFFAVLNDLSAPFSAMVPLGGLWAYYGRQLGLDMLAMPDLPRRAGVRRLYRYILALLGLGATFLGMYLLLSFVVRAGVHTTLGFTALRAQLANGLATLAIGLPLWYRSWNPANREAALPDTEGEAARRSIIRKAYLYLVLFAGVVGGMVSGGRLIYVLLSRVFGNPVADPLSEALEMAALLALFVLWLAYHLAALRGDTRHGERSMAGRHAAYPVLVLDSGDCLLGKVIAEAIRKQSPRIPVAVHCTDGGVPPEELSNARAVILSAALVTEPPEALRVWLAGFGGERLILPAAGGRWRWLGFAAATPAEQAAQAALAVRQMAEGHAVRLTPPLSAWAVMGYVFGAFFALQVIFALFSLLFSRLVD